MMTHGSVVAREVGIPAMVGVHEATRRLQTGQRVARGVGGWGGGIGGVGGFREDHMLIGLPVTNHEQVCMAIEGPERHCHARVRPKGDLPCLDRLATGCAELETA
jgi:PEP-utilizing family enzyme